jgi:ABC-2 type transport system ATP-binding protein
MNRSPITIQVKDLIKKFGDFTAVNKISFEVRKGEIYGFLGPNGSGKTTTIRMMLGLIPPTAGEIEVLGVPIDGQNRAVLPRIGYMSQHFSLYNDLSVNQNLLFYGQAYGIQPHEMKERIQKAVSMAGLDGYEDSPTKDLSGGWRQRLALSAAILHQPEVLFLDEPTAGVDPISRREFWDLLYKLVAEGITVFITTHYMDEAEHCHRLAFIQRGEIIARGSPTEIKKQTMPGKVLEINSPTPLKLITNIKKEDNPEISAELYGNMIHVVTPKPRKTTRELKELSKAKKITIDSISQIEPTLEDVFITCMQEQ